MDGKQKNWHFATALIANARLGRAMIIGSFAYGILALLPIPIFSCPWKSCTGLPCPGCGMTRSVMALLKGDIALSLKENALTLVILLFFLVVAVGVSLPGKKRIILIRHLGAWENRSKWGLWFGIILTIYTLTRWGGIL